MRLNVQMDIEQWPLAAPFRITGHTFTVADLLIVTLREGSFIGRGEAAGVYYLGETADRMMEQVERIRDRIEAGVDREELLNLLPAGGARNAVDCALWDLEAKRSSAPVWRLAAIREPRPLLTTYTLGADEPGRMASKAGELTHARALKLKLTGDDADAERVAAVRAARPDAWLGVDANQGLTRAGLMQLMPVLQSANVRMIEQPVRRGCEGDLDSLHSPIPLAADESALDSADLPALVGRFDIVNIKLDKCGGLTAALAMAQRARELAFGVMVGSMVSTSLAIAPAFVFGQLCDFADLDGATFLKEDRQASAQHAAGSISCPARLWGYP